MVQYLHQLLHRCAEAALSQQAPDGSLPGGVNGPWNDPETPVRNTGHWLITFLKVFEATGDSRFKRAAEKAAAYLLSEKSRPMAATFWHRTNPERDFCNGLIGSAWTIEALVYAAGPLGLEEGLKVAEEVHLMHPFLDGRGVWRVVNVDGSFAGADPTFNHQLWFAASGALLASATGNREILRRIIGFMDHLDSNFAVRRSGAVRHAMKPWSLPRRVYQQIGIYRQGLGYWKGQQMKEVGYHAFNLLGFGLLRTGTADHPFWRSEPFRKAMALVETDWFRERLEESPYGYPYNPPGFEVPYALLTFSDYVGEAARSESKLSAWISRQLAKTYTLRTRRMDRSNPDPNTLTARLYEAVRLPDLPIEVPADGQA